MLFLSELINRPILDRSGAEMARVLDVVVRLAPDGADACPRLHGLVARTERGGAGFFLPAARLGSLGSQGAKLSLPSVTLEAFERRPGELLLGKDVWDHRVIDPHTRHARRVNDVALGVPGTLATPAAGYPPEQLEAIGVDVGLAGIARRLGLRWAVSGPLGKRLTLVLPWQEAELLTGQAASAPARHDHLAGMHPADIATLTEQVSTPEAAEIIAALDDEIAADVLEELPADRQADIVEYLSDARAADIIEEMEPDDASDLLGDLPQDRAADIIEEMEPDAVAPVQTLLAYPDKTAGGMMTTSFISVGADETVAGAVAALRREVEKPNLLLYVYVVAPPDRLLGTVTLRDLLLATPDTPLREIMQDAPAFVAPEEEDRVVARKMAEYNLADIPVLDDDGRLLGVVTVDDALDVLLPSGWQRRLPRLFG